MKYQAKEVKISTALYSIAKNEKFSKTAVTFLVYDNMFVNSYYTTILWNFDYVYIYIYISRINLSDSFITRFSISKINPSLKESSL